MLMVPELVTVPSAGGSASDNTVSVSTWDQDAVADALIFVAYFLIPVQLMVVFKSVRIPMVVQRIRLAFFCFILSCGVTHLLATLPHGWPWLSSVMALSKWTCAVVSLATAVFLHIHFIDVRELLRQGSQLEKEIAQSRAALIDMHKRHSQLGRQHEEALRLARAKSDFVATMSHETRTPLWSIIGFADILEGTKLSDWQHEHVSGIQKSASHLLCLINDVLDCTRLEHVEYTLEKAAFSLTACLNTVKSMMEIPAKENGVRLCMDVENPGVNQVIHADERRLTQVLTNITSNAIKFTPRNGKVTFRASVVPATYVQALRDDPAIYSAHPKIREPQTTSRFFVFSVQDSGVGIEPAKIPIIFDRFMQADNSIERKFGGTGLGLSICKVLVEKMEGGIFVRSSPRSGSTFIVCIPSESLSPSPPSTQVARPKVILDKRIADAQEKVTRKRPTAAVTPHVPSGIPPVRSRAIAVPDTVPIPAPAAHYADLALGSIESDLPILVAEDNETNQLIMKRMMQQLGYRNITFVANGQEAVDHVKAHPDIKCIFLDIHMPVMDGIRACQAIRAIPGRQSLWIMALTADSSQEFLSLGFDDHILKPCRKEQLHRSIVRRAKDVA
ncbi:Hybrid signal transduction histidine kinase A [Hondaea fermentalgiana]|uniref:histidine kinase n=1 Tax=Hondaea fermentalgiana TaxID=2315210 RepID=A0A2R5GIR6_9STRA|nr:Hybrid signal transduction histidine kinase A [Hondaea fermentalgiana]|eukprot:GBG30782.1 Hybrid signal transduction histidine kinase A [Hondaea fermentalgiana]